MPSRIVRLAPAGPLYRRGAARRAGRDADAVGELAVCVGEVEGGLQDANGVAPSFEPASVSLPSGATWMHTGQSSPCLPAS